MGTNGKITVVGSANIDLIMKLPRLPRPAETVTGGEFLQAHGGKGANQAVAAARAGRQVDFVGCVGDDAYAPQILENLSAAGIDAGGVTRVPGVATGTALIMVNESGQNMIGVAPGANSRLGPDQVAACRARIESASLVMLQMEIPAPAVMTALEIARKAKTPVMMNYAPAGTVPLQVSDSISVLVVNEPEAEALTGIPVPGRSEAETAAIALLERGPKAVIVTLGADGALAAEGDEVRHVPAFPVQAMDATAAGDTFCGALAAAMVEGRPLLDGVRFASAAAALSATRLGAQPSIPFRREIEEFLSAGK